MMSCTTSAAWSHHVSSLCYTEHGQRCGAILTGHITTVAIYRSDQLGLHYTVEPNCSDMSVRLADASVTCTPALDTCETSCVPGAARSFFIHVVHSPLGAVGYVQHRSSPLGEAMPGHVAAPKPTSIGRRGPELMNTWQRRSSPLGKAESGAMGHMAAPEPTSTGRQGPELRYVWRHRSSTQQGDEARGHRAHGSTRAHLCKEVRSGATGHVEAPEPTSTWRCGPKLQLAW
jgi:hypothetical protein